MNLRKDHSRIFRPIARRVDGSFESFVPVFLDRARSVRERVERAERRSKGEG